MEPSLEEILNRPVCIGCKGKYGEHCYPDCVAPLTPEERESDNGVNPHEY